MLLTILLKHQLTSDYYYCYTHLTAFFSRTVWVSSYQTGKTSLNLNEARDDGVLGCSGISWTICKQSAPHSRQVTTSTPHHSILQAKCSSYQKCQSSEEKHELKTLPLFCFRCYFLFVLAQIC